VDNSISEEDDFHLLDFGLLVVGGELLLEVLLQIVKVFNLFVVARLFRLQEVNKDGVSLSIRHAVVFVFALEVLLELVI